MVTAPTMLKVQQLAFSINSGGTLKSVSANGSNVCAASWNHQPSHTHTILQSASTDPAAEPQAIDIKPASLTVEV